MTEVTDLADADRIARKLARLQAKRARVKAEYEAALAKELGRHDRHISYCQDRLHRFLARQLEEDPDGDPLAARTVGLPCKAKLNYRPTPIGQMRLMLKDEAALIDWLREDEEGDRVDRHYSVLVDETRVDRGQLRKALEDGIPIEGAYLADPQWAVYSVTIPKSLLSDEAEDEEAGA